MQEQLAAKLSRHSWHLLGFILLVASLGSCGGSSTGNTAAEDAELDAVSSQTTEALSYSYTDTELMSFAIPDGGVLDSAGDADAAFLQKNLGEDDASVIAALASHRLCLAMAARAEIYFQVPREYILVTGDACSEAATSPACTVDASCDGAVLSLTLTGVHSGRS